MTPDYGKTRGLTVAAGAQEAFHVLWPTARRLPKALTSPDTSSMTPDYGKTRGLTVAAGAQEAFHVLRRPSRVES